MLDWPPAYTLRRSLRARRISLRICPERGLILVVPKRSSEKTALEFLHQQKAWVQQHQQLLIKSPQEKKLPSEIHLAAINQTWQVRSEKVSGYRKIKLLQLPQELVLFGEELIWDKCQKVLQQWLYQTAERELFLWIKQLSNECQLPFKQLSIRNQMTLWGSCTADKNISLNVKLLFLPNHLAKYILIHELCHTKYLNHSAKFWRLVAEFIPDYRNCVRQMKELNKNDFPVWFYAG